MLKVHKYVRYKIIYNIQHIQSFEDARMLTIVSDLKHFKSYSLKKRKKNTWCSFCKKGRQDGVPGMFVSNSSSTNMSVMSAMFRREDKFTHEAENKTPVNEDAGEKIFFFSSLLFLYLFLPCFLDFTNVQTSA